MKNMPFLFLVSIFVCGSAFPEDTYTLKEKYPVNQPLTYEMKLSLNLHLLQKSETGQKEENLSNQSIEHYTDTYLELDPAGLPIQAKRDYQTAQSVQNGQPAVVNYNGKTVYFQKTGEQITVSSPGVTLSQEEIEDLKGELPDASFEALLPNHPLKIGEGWIANEQAIVKLLKLNETTRGTLKGKLVKIESFENQNCAFIEFNLVATTSQGGMDLSMDLSGKVCFSLDQNRFVSVEVDGPIQASGEVTADQGKMQIQGEGKMQCSLKNL